MSGSKVKCSKPMSRVFDSNSALLRRHEKNFILRTNSQTLANIFFERTLLLEFSATNNEIHLPGTNFHF